MNNYKSENRSPLKFFLLVYGLSILLWIIETRIDVKGLPLDIPITDILAAFTPMIAASILVYREEGLIGVKKLFKRILDFPRITQKIWYGCAISLPCLVYVLIYIIIYLLGLPLPFNFHISFLSIPFLFCLFFIGAVAEEIGYMGYAIDTIQKRFGALSASILVGIPWAVWHYPSIIQQGHNLTWIAWATLGTEKAIVFLGKTFVADKAYNSLREAIAGCRKDLDLGIAILIASEANQFKIWVAIPNELILSAA